MKKNIFVAVSVVTLFNLSTFCLADCETAKGKIAEYSEKIKKLKEEIKILSGLLDRQVVRADLSVAKSAIKNLQRAKQDKKCVTLQAKIDLSLAEAQAGIKKFSEKKKKKKILRKLGGY